MGCPSGHFSGLLPVFFLGSEDQAACSSVSPTQARPPVRPGLGILFPLCCLTFSKLLEFSDPQLAPPQTKRLAEVLAEVPAVCVPPLLSVGREALLLSARGARAGGAVWERSQ